MGPRPRAGAKPAGKRALPRPRTSDAAVRLAEAEELPPYVAAADPQSFRDALHLAGKRPDDSAPSGEKVAYAARFSGLVAKTVANALRAASPSAFQRIRSGEEQVGQGTAASKKIDVLLATDRQGMQLNISIKTQSFRDFQKGRVKATKSYTHNITRVIDQELQLEALKSHSLFPHAVLVALVVFPATAWTDANPKREGKRTDSDCSSAAEFAQRLRLFHGRSDTRDADQERSFEACFIAVHGIASLLPSVRPMTFKDDVAFFEVHEAIPHAGLPAALLTFDQFLTRVRQLYEARWNITRKWSA